jgi:hypothetical protein
VKERSQALDDQADSLSRLQGRHDQRNRGFVTQPELLSSRCPILVVVRSDCGERGDVDRRPDHDVLVGLPDAGIEVLLAQLLADGDDRVSGPGTPPFCSDECSRGNASVARPEGSQVDSVNGADTSPLRRKSPDDPRLGLMRVHEICPDAADQALQLKNGAEIVERGYTAHEGSDLMDGDPRTDLAEVAFNSDREMDLVSMQGLPVGAVEHVPLRATAEEARGDVNDAHWP